MARQLENIKVSRIITKHDEVKRFIDTEGSRYGLKPIGPEPVSPPDYPTIVVVEPWRREPTQKELLEGMKQFKERHHDAKMIIPDDAVADCVKQRNAIIAFYNEANGKQWHRQDNWCNKNVNLEDWYGVKATTKCVICAPGRRPIKFQTVTCLELSHNNIYCGKLEDNGRISSRIGDLKDLEVLNLSYNFIQGRIPDRLWELTKLRELYLNFNQLEGKISPKIGNLTQLQRVQLDHNHLTGVIPDAIGNLKDLEGLFLHMNNLDSYWRYYMLLQLRKGNNTIEKRPTRLPSRYQTPIPASFAGLKKLKEFYAYQNQLYGAIPAAVKNNPNFKCWNINPQQDDVELT